MKALLFSLAIALSATTEVNAQFTNFGTVRFANFDASRGFYAPVSLMDGTPVSRSNYTAELLAGPTEVNLHLVATTTFLSAGYFDGGVQSITNVPGGGVAWFLLRVWLSSGPFYSFSEAQTANIGNTWYESYFFEMPTGNPKTPDVTAPLGLIGLTPPIFLNPYLEVIPFIRQSYNPINRTITLFWEFTGTLQTSTNLIDWKSVATVPPQTFSADQMRQYFRAIAPR